MLIATFQLLTASLLQAMGSTGSGTALFMAVVCCDWCVLIQLLFLCTVFSSGICLLPVHRWLSCFFIAGIHASGISAPLSILMLFGLSLM